MPMQKPSRLLPDDSHHLMATDCVLPQVALWGKGMVCALKRTSGLNGWISNQKHISLQSVALREGSRGFEVIIIIYQLKYVIIEILGAITLTTQLNGSSRRVSIYFRFYTLHNGTWNIISRQFTARHGFFQCIKMLQLQFVGTAWSQYRT